MSEWRDHQPGRTGLSVAQLDDEESMTVQGTDEPYREDTDQSEDALHVPVTPIDVPSDAVDMSGEDLDTEEEYNIINSSSGFFAALKDAFPEGESLTGKQFEITAHQEGEEDTSRWYEIEQV